MIAILPSGLTHLSIILLGFLSIGAFIIHLEFSKIPSAKQRYSHLQYDNKESSIGIIKNAIGG